MSTLARYRELVPEHASVLDGPINVWLGVAIKRFDQEAFGVMYDEAVVWWAAHRVQTSPGSGAPGAPPAVATGALVSQTDGDLSRTYAQPSSSSGGTASDADLKRTSYGMLFLDIRDSRDATSPFLVL